MGRPHISGLGEKTPREDLRERFFAAGMFVTGHAEKTFVDILDNVARVVDTNHVACQWYFAGPVAQLLSHQRLMTITWTCTTVR
jgi:hypothetical protein